MNSTHNHQAKYEVFLDDQMKKQRAVWFSCLPEIMDELTRAINLTNESLYKGGGMIKVAKFEDRTLTKLRQMLVKLKKIMDSSERGYDQEIASRRLIGDMISQINSWYCSSKVACGIKESMNPYYTGEAVIAEKYNLLIRDDFNVTCNRG